MSNVSVNLNELNARLAEISRDLVPGLVSALHRKVMLDLLAGVVKRTPVDRGRARAGWYVDVAGSATGAPPVNAEERGPVGSPNGPTFAAGTLKILAEIKPFTVTYVMNNVQHAVVLDQGGYVPKDPADDSQARESRAKRRSKRRRERAIEAFGHPGATLVKGGYSFQAPNGMVALTLEEIRRGLQ